MANFTDDGSTWPASVPTLAATDPVRGGDEDQPSNVPLRELNKRVVYLKAGLDALGLSAQVGAGTFAGDDDGAKFTHTHDLGHTNYHVQVTPSADTGGDLGDVTVVPSANSFDVYNTGGFTGAFSWLLVEATS